MGVKFTNPLSDPCREEENKEISMSNTKINEVGFRDTSEDSKHYRLILNHQKYIPK
jgi:hypothetical protein